MDITRCYTSYIQISTIKSFVVKSNYKITKVLIFPYNIGLTLDHGLIGRCNLDIT